MSSKCPICLSNNTVQDVGEKYCYDCHYDSQNLNNKSHVRIAEAFKNYERKYALESHFSTQESEYRISGLQNLFDQKINQYSEETNKAWDEYEKVKNEL